MLDLTIAVTKTQTAAGTTSLDKITETDMMTVTAGTTIIAVMNDPDGKKTAKTAVEEAEATTTPKIAKTVAEEVVEMTTLRTAKTVVEEVVETTTPRTAKTTVEEAEETTTPRTASAGETMTLTSTTGTSGIINTA